MKGPTERFSSRVDNYVRYRPGYPPEVAGFLLEHAGLAGSVVADVGCGPGNLTRLLLPHARRVYGIEPNREMREAGRTLLGKWMAPHEARFVSVDGTAEATGLAAGSVDLIAAGQAFHWFAPEPTRTEFRRILRSGGAVALVWNERDGAADAFSAAYERFLRSVAPEYGGTAGTEKTPPPAIAAFLAPAAMQVHEFANGQVLDWDGFRGRVESSSYFPEPDQDVYPGAIAALRELFDRFAVGGQVTVRYRSRLYFARW